jgi:hypothetical protein
MILAEVRVLNALSGIPIPFVFPDLLKEWQEMVGVGGKEIVSP